MKIYIILALTIVLVMALKPSEAGINDWHIANIGQIRSLSFSKNKIQYISYLGQIGILDKLSGKIETRFVVPEAEKIVSWGDEEIIVATRHNQLVTYSFKPSGIAQFVNNQYLSDSKIDSYIKVGKKQFSMTSQILNQTKITIREAQQNEQFLKITGGLRKDGSSIIFLVYVSNGQICVENYYNSNFHNKLCFESGVKKLSETLYKDGILIVSTSQITYVLSEELNVIYKIQEPLIEFISGIAVFANQYYNSNTNETVSQRPILTKGDAKISFKQISQSVIIYKDQIEVTRVSVAQRSKVLRCWFNLRSQLDYDLILQFNDLQLISYSFSREGSYINWKRQQSLGYIQDVIFLKYNKLDTLDNPYHRNLISHSYRNLSFIQKLSMIPKDIILRFTQQFTDISNHIISIANYLIENLRTIDIQSVRKFKMPKQQQIKYGLRKYIIAATKYGTLIAIDSKTKDIIWKINHGNKNYFISLILLKRDYQTENAILVTYSKDQKKIIIQEILQNGQIQYLDSRTSIIPPQVYKLNDHSLLLKIGDKIQKFRLIQNDDLIQKQYYFYSNQNNIIQGWKINQNKVYKIWNFQVKGNQKIMKIATAFRGDQRSHIPLYDREKVFFKNVDFTNIAVLTNINHTSIGLYIINGRTGKVQFNSYKNNINNGLPVNLVYDQNNVLISYYHSKNKFFQIWTIEQYQQRIQNSALNMIADYLNDQSYKPQQNRQQTIFESQVYGSPVAIKEMYVSQSKMSLTRRNIFIITRQNKLYTISRDFVNTRRPRKDLKQAKGFFSNQKLPQYTYILPFNPSFYLSYDLPIQNIKSVKFSPADMQSSIFVFCYGVDNFLIRTAPDKTFDMITEDFNYLVLLLILVAGTAAILIFRSRLYLAKLKKPHIQ